MVQDFSIGIGGMGGIPSWALELPTIDEDDLTEAEKENLGICLSGQGEKDWTLWLLDSPNSNRRRSSGTQRI